MNILDTLNTISTDQSHAFRTKQDVVSALMIAWAYEEPERIGDVALLGPTSKEPWVLGRGPAGSSSQLGLYRQRPGRNLPTGPLRSQRISRAQLHILVSDDTLEIDNVGRRTMLVNGRECTRAQVRSGDVIELRNQMLFLVTQRPMQLPALDLPPLLMPRFGEPDAFGMVGESPTMWTLRSHVGFAAARRAHVLVQGASGTGKELVARAIHGLSGRHERDLVARNAATIPDSLVDAELFGNAKNYPNPGMAERDGLIGAADCSTLFLDEIGELSHEMQAHLLRVLDQGEYQRLGEARMRRADIRLIAATNRTAATLKHDFLARLTLRLSVPGLGQRRDDIPLLVRYLLRRIAAADPQMATRFFTDGDADRLPRISPTFLCRLLRAPYATHVRELEALLWQSMFESQDGRLESVELATAPPPQTTEESEPVRDVDPASLSPEEIQTALDQADGVQEQAWRALGLRNRYQLIRLIKKHGLTTGRGRAGRAESEVVPAPES
ncbi:sigma 54-interacting transcriptional regulator [Haliangium sp.]|uniref:sigma 54-interacting transcriptional regulator n=1 Tax=Haliangium sp. TaxID=2663208 RepID=UPI003D0C622E